MTLSNSTYPVILVEGLDGVGKSTLVEGLTKRLNASLISSPPRMIDPLSHHQDLRVSMDVADSSVRREYYRCANFHASLLVAEAKKRQPVILDRYWPSTASFAVIDNHAPIWEPLGMWPLGLVVPDIMVLLTVSEDVRLQRMANRGIAITEEETKLENVGTTRDKVLGALRCFEPIEIDTSFLSEEEVLEEVISWLQKAGILSQETTSLTPTMIHSSYQSGAEEEFLE